MGHWALVKLAVWILPNGKRRDAIIEHVDGCPSCGARLAGRNEARGVLVKAEDVGGPENIWPRVEHVLNTESSASVRPSAIRISAGRRRLFPWRWAAVAGGICVAAAITLLVVPGVRLRRAAGPGFPAVPTSESLRILSASVAGRPAELYVVDVPEDRMTLVWFERQPEKGERS